MIITTHAPRLIAWPRLPADYTPERELLRAIIRKAVRDYLFGGECQIRDAHAYLHGPNFAADCDWLDLNPAHVRRLIQEHPLMVKRLLTSEQIHQAHADYLRDSLTIEQTAAAHNVSAATLSRYFAQENLPVRPHRPPQPRRRGSDTTALHELNRVLSQLADLPAAGRIRLQIEIDLNLNEENQS